MWRPNVSYEMVGACGSLMPNVNIRMKKIEIVFCHSQLST